MSLNIKHIKKLNNYIKFKEMKMFFKKNFKIVHFVGLISGALFGYAYYYVSCKSGVCTLKSNPYLMVIYGALIGYFVLDLLSISYSKIRKNKDKSNDNSNPENNIG